MAIIGISGKINSGKDTVAKIISLLVEGEHLFVGGVCEETLEVYDEGVGKYRFETKRFADKLKDIVCLLINCTREQLEDRSFKEKPLGEEWRVYYMVDPDNGMKNDLITKEVYNEWKEYPGYGTEVLTPRKLLQLLGTDCGRQIIHPNIWVNALMSEYKSIYYEEVKSYKEEPDSSKAYSPKEKYPNWIVPDVRFPNEVKAIEDKGGIVIRINRPSDSKETHPSETALDDYSFSYTIQNDSDIQSLVAQVKAILIDLKMI